MDELKRKIRELDSASSDKMPSIKAEMAVPDNKEKESQPKRKSKLHREDAFIEYLNRIGGAI